MSYETAVASMFALGHELAHTPSHKFDLAHMRVLLRATGSSRARVSERSDRGNEWEGIDRGDAGFDSASFGLKTGLYTSPHLVRINERIRIDGEEISDDDFARLHGEVDRIAERLVAAGELPWHPSFFEMMTAIAFSHFAQRTSRRSQCSKSAWVDGWMRRTSSNRWSA